MLMLMSEGKKDEIQQLYPFKSNYLDLEGKSYHYIDEGRRDAPVMLCLHGNPTWSFYYREVIKTFCEKYRVIAPDHLGCGLSDKPQNYSYKLNDHIDNVLFLIHSLGLKNITLVVHDWGGAIGMGVATMAPSLVGKIVLMNTAAFISPHIPWRISVCRLPFLGEWLVRRFNAFAYPATFMASSKGLSPAVKKGYLMPYRNYQDRVAIARFVQDIPMSEGHPTYSTLSGIEQRLGEIHCPVLILWGARDFCFTTENFYQRWMSIFPKAQSKLYEDAGHYVLEDRCEDVLRKIAAFMEQ